MIISSGNQDDCNPQALEATSAEKIRKRIKAAKARKVPVPDSISNQALKALPNKAVAALTGIINAMLILSHFPLQWKCANVIVLLKSSQARSFTQKYRLISLLCLLIVLRKLQWTLDVGNVL